MFGNRYIGGVCVDRVTVAWRSREPLPNDLNVAHSFAKIVPPPRTDAPPLLLDFRIVRGRNDPTFETLLREPRRRLFERFGLKVILVASPAGALQMDRFAREDGVQLSVVVGDEARAAAMLGWSTSQVRSALFNAQMAVTTVAAKTAVKEASALPAQTETTPTPTMTTTTTTMTTHHTDAHAAAAIARDTFRRCALYAQERPESDRALQNSTNENLGSDSDPHNVPDEHPSHT